VTSNDKRKQQQRENPEPSEGSVQTPKIVLLWIFILLVWGVGYYAWQIGKPMLGGDSRSPVEVTRQHSEGAEIAEVTEKTEDAEAAQSAESVKSVEATAAAENSGNTDVAAATESAGTSGANGEQIFAAHCAACHQATGQGIPGAFPPLAGSKWVAADDPNLPLAIVHDGLSGEIEVAGATYNGVMPPFKGTLSSEEIAAVLTYARHEWGNNANSIDVSVVEKHNESFGNRGSWTVDELKQTFQTP